jgi:hypothetical protein
LLRTGADEWIEWLAEEPVRLAPAEHALEYAQHAFRSAEIMAAHPVIGHVYRAATELSLPHFASTLLLAGSESDPTRTSVTFGDRDFHLGLAELCLGMAESLGAAQLRAVIEFAETFGVTDVSVAQAHAASLEAIASRKDRCSISMQDIDGQPRFVITNWRRNPGGATQRILL